MQGIADWETCIAAGHRGTRRRSSRQSWYAAVVMSVTAWAVLSGSSALGQARTWRVMAPMPTPRGCLAAGTIDGVLYAAGGSGGPAVVVGNGILGTLEAYDPKTDKWMSKAPMPVPQTCAASAVVNGVLYVMGGEGPDARVTAATQAYDPGSDTWIARAPMPSPRSIAAAAAVNGIIYVVGGYAPGATASTLAYDPNTDSWTSKAPMITPRTALAAASMDGLVYAVGGIGAGSASDLRTLEAYNPKTDSWTSATPMPTGRNKLAAAVAGGLLYVVGGASDAQGSDQALANVEAYDPKSNSWIVPLPMPTARYHLAAATAEDVVYVLGGDSISPPLVTWLATNEAFTPFEMVSIDIKPGDATNTINLKSNGVVPVAILGSATFDPMTVEPTTVTFAGANVAIRGRGVPMTGVADVNHDGYPDLLLYFRTQDLTALSRRAAARRRRYSRRKRCSTARRIPARRIRGSDTVRIVPAPNSRAVGPGGRFIPRRVLPRPR